ncbi:MAG TPA: hypothetical protein VEK57_21040 [Thermoanaerobaculia bacterium]|nr:hypothetical protein [Thermoanaerobaculia bacterium]
MRALILCVLLAATSPLAASTLWGDLKPGPHAVGFKGFPLRDATRTARPGSDAGDRSQTLMVSVWYPAQRVAGATPMTFDDYGRFERYDPVTLVDASLATLGWRLINDRNLDAAKAVARLVAAQAAGTVYEHNLAGNIDMAEGRTAEAVTRFEKALAALPDATRMTPAEREQSRVNIQAKIDRLRGSASR